MILSEPNLSLKSIFRLGSRAARKVPAQLHNCTECRFYRWYLHVAEVHAELHGKRRKCTQRRLCLLWPSKKSASGTVMAPGAISIVAKTPISIPGHAQACVLRKTVRRERRPPARCTPAHEPANVEKRPVEAIQMILRLVC